ncbi:DUF1871 family protein [Paenibacillus tyrfis]|uniref:DUF1871 family protein n=1 Tax=Paenibacillus tyrfis TaxID=1501230 RepID=UPI0013768155|nr:DUF1871 family protein [Paenibacillus tyrfis]
MKNLIRQVIHEWNPYGLLPCAPDNEFDSEIEKVTKSLQQVNTLEELARSIQEIFSLSFGEPFKYERCLSVADQIWNKANEQS